MRVVVGFIYLFFSSRKFKERILLKVTTFHRELFRANFKKNTFSFAPGLIKHTETLILEQRRKSHMSYP